MTLRTTYHCNTCGKETPASAAVQFAGIWQGQSVVAAGGEHGWHSCSWPCAVRHLRDVAAGIERRGRELDAARAAEEKRLRGEPERDPGPASGE